MGYPAPDCTDDILDRHLSQLVSEKDGCLGKSPLETGGDKASIASNAQIQNKAEQLQENATPKIDIVPRSKTEWSKKNGLVADKKVPLKKGARGCKLVLMKMGNSQEKHNP